MNACYCSLAGTVACRTCSNNPYAETPPPVRTYTVAATDAVLLTWKRTNADPIKTMKTFKIYFSDLIPSTQKELLEFVKADTAKDMNWDIDILPIAIAEFEIEEGEEVKEAKWEALGHRIGFLKHPLSEDFRCSNCGYEAYTIFAPPPEKCPRCKAKMTLKNCPFCNRVLSEIRENNNIKYRYCYSCHFDFKEKEE